MTIATLLERLHNRKTQLLLINIVLILLIWTALPTIQIHGSHPFSSINLRIILITLLILGYLYYVIFWHNPKNISKAKKLLKHGFRKIRQLPNTLSKYIKQLIKMIKIRLTYLRQKSTFLKSPWYLTLNTPSNLTEQLHLPTLPKIAYGDIAVSHIKNYHEINWRLTEKTIFLDGVLNSKQLTTCLKKLRKNRPLNGIIIALSLIELQNNYTQKKAPFSLSLQQQLQSLFETCHFQLPIYIIITDLQQLTGFDTYTYTLPIKNKEEILGIQFPMDSQQTQAGILEIFQYQFMQIIEALQNHLTTGLNQEKSIENRLSLAQFPLSLAYYKDTLKFYLKALFTYIPGQYPIHLRGIYFTNLSEKKTEKIQFTKKLHQQSIFPEAHLLGEQLNRLKLKKWIYFILRYAKPTSAILLLVLLAISLQKNLNGIKNIGHGQTLLSETALTTNPSRIDNIITLLEKYQYTTSAYTQNTSALTHLLPINSVLNYQLNEQKFKLTQSLLLPKVAALIETKLKDGQLDYQSRYALMKAYLAFDHNYQSIEPAVFQPIIDSWSTQFGPDSFKFRQLKAALALAISKPLITLPLDQKLISQVREILKTQAPAERAFANLNLIATASKEPPLHLISSTTETKSLFTQQTLALSLPPLYTAYGYKHIYLKNEQKIINDIYRDNTDLGLNHLEKNKLSKASIQKKLQESYNKNYTYLWQTQQNKIRIKAFKNLMDATHKLEVFSQSQGPLSQLTQLIQHNTSTIEHGQINVSTSYATLKDLNLKEIQKALIDLSLALKALSTEENPEKAAYQYVIKQLKSTNTPLAQLAHNIETAPEPIKTVLFQIINESWRIIQKYAQVYLNKKWKIEVYTYYTTYIHEHFPINLLAQKQITMMHFNQFFAENGKLMTYFKQYLKPLLVDHGQKFQQKRLKQTFSLNLSEQLLSQIKHTQEIRQQFFPTGGSQARLTFRIKPYTLSQNSAYVLLSIGHTHINYQHGPQKSYTVHWPLPEDETVSAISVSAFSGKVASHSFDGPWSLFQLMHQGLINTDHIVTFKFSSLVSRFKILDLDKASAIFSLQTLKQFELPKQLFAQNNTKRKAQ